MTKDGKEPAPAAKAADSGAKAQGGGKKNAAALSAALRANLARRKACERALKANPPKFDSEA